MKTAGQSLLAAALLLAACLPAAAAPAKEKRPPPDLLSKPRWSFTSRRVSRIPAAWAATSGSPPRARSPTARPNACAPFSSVTRGKRPIYFNSPGGITTKSVAMGRVMRELRHDGAGGAHHRGRL